MIDSFQGMPLRNGNRTIGVFTAPEKQAAASVSSFPLFYFCAATRMIPLLNNDY